jgi:hypothetical protein
LAARTAIEASTSVARHRLEIRFGSVLAGRPRRLCPGIASIFRRCCARTLRLDGSLKVSWGRRGSRTSCSYAGVDPRLNRSRSAMRTSSRKRSRQRYRCARERQYPSSSSAKVLTQQQRVSDRRSAEVAVRRAPVGTQCCHAVHDGETGEVKRRCPELAAFQIRGNSGADICPRHFNWAMDLYLVESVSDDLEAHFGRHSGLIAHRECNVRPKRLPGAPFERSRQWQCYFCHGR